MPELDFESDQFLQLLTDALRSGPGSPEWHGAVTSLRGGNGSVAMAPDRAAEYELLIAARQHLESGRDYRSIRAGAGFTRRVMEAVEREPDSGGNPPLTTSGLVTALSALLVIIAA